MEKPTVALQMIIKDEPIEMLVINAEPYFDEVNLTVSNHRRAIQIEEFFKKHPKVHVKFRRWNSRFNEARNANFAMATTEYAFWLDADDSFDFSAVPELVEIAEKYGIDALFLPYNYAQDDDGNCVTRQYRERLLRLDSGFTWKGWVHETPIWDDGNYKTHIIDNPEVKHNMTTDHFADSLGRNHKILEEAYRETDDPRYVYYYGMSLFTLEQYEDSIKVLLEYLQVGGSEEDIYRAMSLISEAAYNLKRRDIAFEYATKCSVLKPEYPMSYWLLAQYEADEENWKEALEWVRVSESKPNPQTLSVWDPSSRERAVLVAAQALFMLGRYNEALNELKKIPRNETAQELYDGFLQEADAETFVSLIPRFRKFFATDEHLWQALCHDLKFDKRLQGLRYGVTKPAQWPDNTITIFCGQGYEEWGPHTLDKGMGGSEEAIVYLAPELAKRGYDVVVYSEVSEPMLIDGVQWVPWQEIDTRDQFNIFVSWRAPQFLEHVNAKVKIADIHDIIPADIVKDYPDVTYFVKSNYHRKLYPKLAASKFRIIGNGIKKEQFRDNK